MFCVYILQSLKDKKFYIGYTSNLSRRMSEHNSGLTKSIKNRTPFKLIYSEDFCDRKLAMKREKQIKSYKGGDAFKHLISGVTQR